VTDLESDPSPSIRRSRSDEISRYAVSQAAGDADRAAVRAGVALDEGSADVAIDHTGATFGDYDGDGNLDLFVAGYIDLDLKNAPLSEHGELVRQLAGKFKSDVESFYDPEVIQQGYLYAQDREGEYREFPLLTVSAVVLELKPGRKTITPAEMSRIMADEKKAAKGGKDSHVRVFCLG